VNLLQLVTQNNDRHPDPTSKQSAYLVCKHRILLYRPKPLHFLEYFYYFNFLYNIEFYLLHVLQFNYNVHVYALVILPSF